MHLKFGDKLLLIGKKIKNLEIVVARNAKRINEINEKLDKIEEKLDDLEKTIEKLRKVLGGKL